MTNQKQSRTVAVVGAGLVGNLAASMLAQRGWTVTLFEGRSDPRLTPPSSRARSINLALSPRGIEALRSVSEELANRVTKEGVRMRGRMLHVKDQKDLVGQDYGVYDQGEFISSISRGLLGIYLLDHVETLGNEINSNGGSVTVQFETKLLEMNLRIENGVDLILQTKGQEESVKSHFDLVIGGDGAYSKVRQEMMRGTRFNYTQTYAKHSYLELSIPPGPNSTYSIEPNFLHIWPRGEFMLIALPNQDKSFTLTLFAHQTTFEELEEELSASKTSELESTINPVIDLFRTEFSDALDLMGEEELLKSWNENPKDGLITVECSPYHYMDKALLIGDAAHAMVPFYGQGMNCAFEDVRVLSTILDHFDASPSRPSKPSTPLPYSSISPTLPTSSTTTSTDPNLSPLALALSNYTSIRAPSLTAIQQLAASNYEEMAHSVLSPLYRLRLSLDNLLAKIFVLIEGNGTEKNGGGKGGSWDSLYRMTTFKYGIAYEEVLARRDWQGKILTGIGRIGLGTTVATLGWLAYSTKFGRK